jgi:hypothetical protein
MARWFSDVEVEHLDPELVRRLDEARGFAKVPFIITSGYREGDPRSHGRGLAVDIACTQSSRRMRIVSGAVLAGFRRIGVYDRHVHLDVDEKLPLDVMWWGVSK